MQKLLTLTEKAAEHAKKLISEAKNPIEGLRISVKNTGCAGMSYDVNYVPFPEKGNEGLEKNEALLQQQKTKDICVEDKGIKLFVDPFASVFLAGSIIDYKSGLLSAGFVFNNPNAKQSCGCGESFTV